MWSGHSIHSVLREKEHDEARVPRGGGRRRDAYTEAFAFSVVISLLAFAAALCIRRPRRDITLAQTAAQARPRRA